MSIKTRSKNEKEKEPVLTWKHFEQPKSGETISFFDENRQPAATGNAVPASDKYLPPSQSLQTEDEEEISPQTRTPQAEAATENETNQTTEIANDEGQTNTETPAVTGNETNQPNETVNEDDNCPICKIDVVEGVPGICCDTCDVNPSCATRKNSPCFSRTYWLKKR